MTRPPLHTRRPFLAGLLRQLPLLAVLVAVGVGLFLVALDHWRWGLVVVGLAAVGAALLRLLLPLRRGGVLRASRPRGAGGLLAGVGGVGAGGRPPRPPPPA